MGKISSYAPQNLSIDFIPILLCLKNYFFQCKKIIILKSSFFCCFFLTSLLTQNNLKCAARVQTNTLINLNRLAFFLELCNQANRNKDYFLCFWKIRKGKLYFEPRLCKPLQNTLVVKAS